MALRGQGIDARWEPDVLAALPDGVLLFSRGHVDYQGSEAIVAELDDGRFVQYEWGYGSCSGCDRWERYDEQKQSETIAADVMNEAAFFTAEGFGDFLIACLAKGAEWLTGKYANGEESYSFSEHSGLEAAELLKHVAEKNRRTF